MSIHTEWVRAEHARGTLVRPGEAWHASDQAGHPEDWTLIIGDPWSSECMAVTGTLEQIARFANRLTDEIAERTLEP